MTPTPTAPSTAVPRSIWNGAVSFAGIDVPAKIFGATDSQDVRFRELQAPDGAEIAHEPIDADGRKVDRRRRR
jgi:DNA end-binding protein Ku